MGLPEHWGCPDVSCDFPLPQLPRQALSLLFDTYHNEVDAFLLADVSTNPSSGPAAQGPSLLLSPSPPEISQLEGAVD